MDVKIKANLQSHAQYKSEVGDISVKKPMAHVAIAILAIIETRTEKAIDQQVA